MKLKHPWRRSALYLLIVLCSILSFVLPIHADIEWSGESGGSGGGGNAAVSNNFTVAATDYNDVVGYRFSLVNGEGEIETNTNGKKTLVWDIYATQSKYWARNGINSYHGGLQYNKIDIRKSYPSSAIRNKILSFKRGWLDDSLQRFICNDRRPRRKNSCHCLGNRCRADSRIHLQL